MNQRRAAFTLIEMLVATALASVLIGAELTIMSRLSRDQRLIALRSDSNEPRGLIVLLRWDIAQANSIENTQFACADADRAWRH